MRKQLARRLNPSNMLYMSEISDNPSIGGTARATKRPDDIKAPDGWENPPVPLPADPIIDAAQDQPTGRDPVRYGDWEKNGLAVDF